MKWWRSLRLHVQLAVLSAIIVALTLIVGTLFSVHKQIDLAYEKMKQEALALARNITITVDYHIVQNDLEEIEKILVKTAGFPGVKKVDIFDARGGKLGSVVSRDGKPRVDYSLRQHRIPEPHNVPKQVVIRHGEKITVWYPIKTSSLLGWLRLEYDVSNIDEIAAVIWKDSLVTSAYTIIIDIVILLLILGVSMKSLNRAREFAVSLVDNKGSRLQLESSSFEVNQIRDSLNELSANLHEQENALTEAIQRAKRADKAKSGFLANISHEIRTPMNGVIGMITLLGQTRLDDKQKQFVETIRESGENLVALISDVLDFSKIESGNVELESHQFELRRVIQNTVDVLAVNAEAKGIQLECNIEDAVPLAVKGDRVRFNQILNNLISNAIKFTEQGRVVIDVSLDESYVPDDASNGSFRLSVQVADTGIGISGRQLARLFQPFTQADITTTRKFGGTGLGLSIAKNLVELMGGEVSVVSEVGRGSQFRFTVKLLDASTDDHVSNDAEGSAMGLGANDDVSGVRILIAEDNPVNSVIVQSFLEKLGYTYDSVVNGAEAVAAVKQQHYDIVLMDLHMPVMDGVEATRRILKDNNHSQPPLVIAVSANILQEEITHCYAIGMQDFVSKPIDFEKFTRVMRKWSQASKLRSAS